MMAIDTEYARNIRAAVENLLIAACCPGHPHTADMMDRAEYFISLAEIDAVLPSEKDLIVGLRKTNAALDFCNDEAIHLLERLESEMADEEESREAP